MAYLLGEPTAQQYFDANGDPLANGTIEFFIWNTSTPTAVYSDSSGTSLGTSVTLNSIGAPQSGGGTAVALFFDDSVTYKIIRKDSGGTAIDPTIGPFKVIPDVSTQSVDDLSGLQGVTISSFSGGEIRYMKGRASVGDGGDGTFIWRTGDKSTEVTADEVTGSGGDGGVWIAPTSDLTGASGAWERLTDRKSKETLLGWRGAIGGAGVDSSVEIQDKLDKGNCFMLDQTYELDTTVEYSKDHNLIGVGKSFQGSILKPTGDFPALKADTTETSNTKMTFRDFQIEAQNVTTDYALDLTGCLLSDFENIWIRNYYKGIKIQDADALNFRGVMVMEDGDNDALFIGDNARSIKFFACNFEKNPANSNPGGVVRVDGSGDGELSSAYFYGCQMERGSLVVENGEVQWRGGKVASSSMQLLESSRDCVIECHHSAGSECLDFGFNNRFVGVNSRNMSVDEHHWPSLIQSSPGNPPTYGSVGEEYVFLISAGSKSSAAVTSGSISIDDGSNLDTSPTFNLNAQGETIGMNKRQSFTYLSVVKIPTSTATLSVSNCNFFGIKGGINLLANGTFASGSATSWTLTDVSESASGSDVLLTPSNSTWEISQSLDSIAKFGQRYIAIAKFSGDADLVYGGASSGSDGARPLISSGITDPWGSGDTIAMLSFEHMRLGSKISLGSADSSTNVTVRWVALIEADRGSV